MAMSLRSVVAGFLLFCFVLLLLPEESSGATSHYVSYTYYVTRAVRHCYTRYYTYCYNWWYWRYWYWGWYWYRPWYYWSYWRPWYGWGYWRYCYRYPSTVCYYTYYRHAYTGSRCQTGWIGSACNVPTCSPKCSGGMVCIDLNKCGCTKTSGTGASCDIVPCSKTNNCYPGTCVNNICKCPDGFSGPNCQEFSHKPAISTCKVQLYGKATASSLETQVAEADCAAEGLEPSVTWVNGALLNKDESNLGLTKIEPVWTANYEYPTAMPTRPPGATSFFVSNAPVAMGFYRAGYTITIQNDSGADYPTPNRGCSFTQSDNTWLTTINCRVSTTWDDLSINQFIKHNRTVIVKMSAQLGGQKTGDDTYSLAGVSYGFRPQYFNGTPVVYQSALKFDLQPPSHCLLTESRDTSGRVNCTVFPIFLDDDDRTDPVITPLFLEWTDNGSGIKTFHVEVFYFQPGADNPDVLEQVGGALDDSVADVSPEFNNYHFTVPRSGVYGIVVTAYDYANNSAKARKMFNYLSEPSYVEKTDSPVFIREANSATGYRFIHTLANPYQLTFDWTGRFEAHPLYSSVLSKRVSPLPVSRNTVDDAYGTQFGQRSIAVVANSTGISSITVNFLVDSDNGGYYSQISEANDTTTVVASGSSTSVLTFHEPLKNGDTVVVWLTVAGATGNQTQIRSSVTIDTTRVNVSSQSFKVNGADEYTSTLSLYVVDRESGINATRYRIIDKRDGVEIVPLTYTEPIKRDAPDSKRRRRGLQTPCYPSDETCYCTPVYIVDKTCTSNCRIEQQCFNYDQTIDIDNCLIDRYSDRTLLLQYWVSNLAGTETSMNDIELGDISAAECRPNGLSGGAIAGIVIACIIGFIILILLVLLIILVIIRIRQHKKPIPSRAEMRTMASNVRHRLTVRSPRSEDNDLYVASQPVNKYNASPLGKSNNEVLYVDPLKVSKKQVQIGDVLNEGRFAIIRRAELTRGNERQTVAIKALKNGFDRNDELLMSKKVAEMKKVPAHGNIVSFVGYVDDDDGQGPMMLLDLCDFPLKDWLSNLATISTDDLETMHVFTLNIAQGVQHLHRHKVIHRRLAVRNVLLKQQANGLVAKLIGFGPTAEDMDEKTDNAGAGVSVPVKWLAPETLDTMTSRRPTYNEKTDIWSYGITVWEIYSRGATPYPDVRSTDIRSQVKRGLRLRCPAECPPELFESAVLPCWKDNPKQRPKVDEIVRAVQEFRSGSNGPQEGYYGTGGLTGSEEIYEEGR